MSDEKDLCRQAKCRASDVTVQCGHYGNGIFGRTACQPFVENERMGLFVGKRQSFRTDLPEILFTLVCTFTSFCDIL